MKTERVIIAKTWLNDDLFWDGNSLNTAHDLRKKDCDEDEFEMVKNRTHEQVGIVHIGLYDRTIDMKIEYSYTYM
jgi:hypothetical protein